MRQEWLTYFESVEFEDWPFSWKGALSRLHLDRNMDDLIRAFSWDGTPQGYDHWSPRETGQTPMEEEDWEFIKCLYLQVVEGIPYSKQFSWAEEQQEHLWI